MTLFSNTNIISELSLTCQQAYKSLSKKSSDKPIGIQHKFEWTVLAGIIACRITGKIIKNKKIWWNVI